MEISDLVKKEIRDLPKTVHGGQAWKLKDIEDYSHNLNPFGPPDCLGGIISSSVSGIDHYPDDSSPDFRGAVAQEFGVLPENVIGGAGSSDIIRMFPNTFLEKGDTVGIFSPSFAEYSQQCKIAGLKIKYLDLIPENDFRIDLDRLKDQLDGLKALYICNPNNPTGRIEPRDKIMEIVSICERKGIIVFLDETLLELVRGYKDISCAAFVNEFTNLVVAGSLTKSFAIPGIRIGFGIAHPSVIDELNKVRMTWNIGYIEQNVGAELISKHMKHVKNAADTMCFERKRMFEELKEMGFPVSSKCDSFFYFCDVSPLGYDAPGFVNAMLEQGIMVRDCSSFGSRFTNYVRFCVKDGERNGKFLDAVRAVIRE